MLTRIKPEFYTEGCSLHFEVFLLLRSLSPNFSSTYTFYNFLFPVSCVPLPMSMVIQRAWSRTAMSFLILFSTFFFYFIPSANQIQLPYSSFWSRWRKQNVMVSIQVLLGVICFFDYTFFTNLSKQFSTFGIWIIPQAFLWHVGKCSRPVELFPRSLLLQYTFSAFGCLFTTQLRSNSFFVPFPWTLDCIYIPSSYTILKYC